jgi:hypothetical protein
MLMDWDIDMSQIKEDKDREKRIDMEIVIDAYDEVERAMGWYYYLEYGLKFPFKACCIEKRATSPLKIGDVVEVIGMGKEDDCMHDMFVNIKWDDGVLSVPLSQLEGTKPSKKSKLVLEDWQYWVKRGYQF